MLTYIKKLEEDYHNTNNSEEKKDIINKLEIEKDRCNKIINENSYKGHLLSKKSEDICDYEKNIISKINSILKSVQK